MFELILCSLVTVLPDYLFRRYVQGKRFGREITLFSVWYELRWGLTLCLILTLSLITTIFYFHPSTKAGQSVFRTVTILPEINGRVEEVFVEINQRVKEGDPIFRLDSSTQEAGLRTAMARLAEVEAAVYRTRAQLAQAEAGIVQSRANLKQAQDEYETRAELYKRNRTAIPRRQVEQAEVAVEARQAGLKAAEATRDAVKAELDIELPAKLETAHAEVEAAQVSFDKTTVVAGTDGMVQQFALRPGDIVNPFLRPAGILVPERKVTGLLAGFSQIEAQVIKPGMIGEATCIAKPWTIVPMVVTEVQPVIASGQVRPTDLLVDMQQMARPGSITVVMEPLFKGQLDTIPQGSSCIVNAYTSSHEALHDPETGTMRKIALHALDATGLVHALILRLQALILPVQTLVLRGH